ncbi:uncharacterized protein LOC118183806 isoform X2 [Stegodyphus dumicola]|uniref:uncharacterized protein LOC118183806 isoform X2 n=1 Tax=Stegodyphus dumicola TaxID=202533 RepID=UPI0015AD0FEF|nr:uncharacterized protein LOC118183806 isoform X2 [Stegodyphus dumicola]
MPQSNGIITSCVFDNEGGRNNDVYITSNHGTLDLGQWTLLKKGEARRLASRITTAFSQEKFTKMRKQNYRRAAVYVVGARSEHSAVFVCCCRHLVSSDPTIYLRSS